MVLSLHMLYNRKSDKQHRAWSWILVFVIGSDWFLLQWSRSPLCLFIFKFAHNVTIVLNSPTDPQGSNENHIETQHMEEKVAKHIAIQCKTNIFKYIRYISILDGLQVCNSEPTVLLPNILVITTGWEFPVHSSHPSPLRDRLLFGSFWDGAELTPMYLEL